MTRPKSRIKILMGIPSKNIKMGGPTIHLPHLVDYFEKSEHFLLRTFDYGSKRDGGSLINTREHTLLKIVNTIQVVLHYVFLLIKHQPDIVHINTAFDKRSLIRDLPISLLSLVFKRKLIFKLHGSSYELLKTKNKFYLFLIDLFFLGSNKIGVLSEFEKNEFISTFGKKDKFIVVKNIVLPLNTKSVSEGLYFTKSSSKIYCLFISRLVKHKGLDDIISTIPLIKKTHPTFILVVAGDGPEKHNAMTLAKALNVQDSIIWLGLVPSEDLPYLMSLSDFFVFLSHLPEGMPMSLVEALRSGIPVVTTRVRFAVSHLQDGVNCLFVNAGNHCDINTAINKLLSEPESQSKMKLLNPSIVLKFKKSIVGEEFEIIYKKMLRKNK